jgi:pimeloyl-ACP methyl ester carboxylesterase
VAIAFTATYPDRTIAACADCAFARCDVHRRTLFRSWRNMAESMPLDEVSDAITIQAVSAEFIEEHPDIFENVRAIVGKNPLHTIRQACLAMEQIDLEALARTIRRPILFTNGTHDIMTPPRLAASGFSAAQVVEAVPDWARLHEFPTIGHADLLECPDEAVDVVTAFFRDALESDG